jgi:flagellin
MALVVNTNIPSIAAQRYLMESRDELETAMERLSSGKRINSAADDAAGLAISTRMATQISGLNVAIKNANDGISMVQTAEGAMQEVTDMLQRMRDLSLQAVHGSNSDDDRAALDAEVQQLKVEIDRVASQTSFNGQNILDGTFNRLFQIGDQQGDTIRIGLSSIDTQSLGLAAGVEAESADVADTLVSARLGATFSWDPVDSTYAGTTASEVTGISFAAGDITINGQELAAFDGTSEDIYDLVANINENVDNVAASAFNTVVAKVVGTGIVR